uniref:Uncharacterized protein n=1 Tax=Amphimedon queenslandica TaxID=400682 RepID=A0A1X7UVL3_AMPQE
YMVVSQTLIVTCCNVGTEMQINAIKIVTTVRHNAHYSAFVYSTCTERYVQESNINAVLHWLKHND